MIRGRADEVMRMLMNKISHPVPPYIRRDSLLIKAVVDGAAASDSKLALLTLTFENICGQDCPLPMVETVSVKVISTGVWNTVKKPTYRFCWELPRDSLYELAVSVALKHPINIESPVERSLSIKTEEKESRTCFVEEWNFVSQRVFYSQAENSPLFGEEYVPSNNLQQKCKRRRSSSK